jgi:hypothetical protein
MKRRILAVAVAALAMASIASAFPVSSAPNGVVQPQPSRCHMRGSYPFNLSDLRCTPGASNRAVTQSTIDRTICVHGWTATQRPSSGVTESEKLASMRGYGVHRSPHQYEYDHLIPLELGGATNDARNLWPEPGTVPNKKDKVENYLHAKVCDGAVSLARAQRLVALDWVHYYKTVVAGGGGGGSGGGGGGGSGGGGGTPPVQHQRIGAVCRDGTTSTATGSGACSHHGGVDHWIYS